MKCRGHDSGREKNILYHLQPFLHQSTARQPQTDKRVRGAPGRKCIKLIPLRALMRQGEQQERMSQIGFKSIPTIISANNWMSIQQFISSSSHAVTCCLIGIVDDYGWRSPRAPSSLDSRRVAPDTDFVIVLIWRLRTYSILLEYYLVAPLSPHF